MQNTATETNALQAVQQLGAAPPAPMQLSNASLIISGDAMDKMLTLANVMASGRSTIPQHLRGSQGDCMAVVMQAMQWGMNPFAVAQKTHLVNGTLGYEAQLVAAVINNSNVIQDRFHFEWFGAWEKIVGKFKEVESRTKKDDNGNPKKYIVPAWNQADENGLGVHVWATIKGETEPRKLTLLMTQARTRNSTLWTEDPKQQIAYLAQKRWARLYAPDVILGVYTPDEIEVAGPGAPRDMGAADLVPTEEAMWDGVPPEIRRVAQQAAEQGLAAYQAFWKDVGPDARKKLAKAHESLKNTATSKDSARTIDAGSAPAQPDPQQTGNPAPAAKTFDEVMAMLCEAKTIDALYVAGDWIDTIQDLDEKAALGAKFDELQATLKGGAA